ncbi:hypothetical protein NFJ02_01g40540 [Pycnococcus provasolii]
MGVRGLTSVVRRHGIPTGVLKLPGTSSSSSEDIDLSVIVDVSALVHFFVPHVLPVLCEHVSIATKLASCLSRIHDIYKYRVILVRDGAMASQGEAKLLLRRRDLRTRHRGIADAWPDANKMWRATKVDVLDDEHNVPPAMLRETSLMAVELVGDCDWLEVITAREDADTLCHCLARERAGIAAVITSDSDFLVAADNVVLLHDLFDRDGNLVMPSRCYRREDVARALVRYAKEKLSHVPNLKQHTAFVSSGDSPHLVHLLRDVAALLGNEALRGSIPYRKRRQLLACLLRRDAGQRGWINHGRATRKLFSDNGVRGEAAWEHHKAARTSYDESATSSDVVGDIDTSVLGAGAIADLLSTKRLSSSHLMCACGTALWARLEPLRGALVALLVPCDDRTKCQQLDEAHAAFVALPCADVSALPDLDAVPDSWDDDEEEDEGEGSSALADLEALLISWDLLPADAAQNDSIGDGGFGVLGIAVRVLTHLGAPSCSFTTVLEHVVICLAALARARHSGIGGVPMHDAPSLFTSASTWVRAQPDCCTFLNHDVAEFTQQRRHDDDEDSEEEQEEEEEEEEEGDDDDLAW